MLRPRCTATCALFALIAVVGCADKTLLPTAARSPLVALQLRTNFAAQNAPTARTIDVRVGYDQLSGSRVALGATTIVAAGGAQQVSISIDLAECIADVNRAGARDACPLRISIALRDTGATALDSLEIGPVDAVAGATPNVPQIDLAIQRFAARQWVLDESLQLGGNPPLNPTGLSAVVSGAGSPTLYQYGPGTGANAVIAFENGRWRTITIGPTSVTLRSLVMLNPTEGWLAASTGPSGLYRFDGVGATAISTISDALTEASAVSIGTSRFVVAVGPGGIVWRGDGTNWIRDTFGANVPMTHACVSAIDEAFVTAGSPTFGSAIWRWNGTQWDPVPLSFGGGLSQLQCPVRGQAFARATNSLVTPNIVTLLSWNGTTFVALPTTGTSAGDLQDFAVVSPTEMYGWGVDAVTWNRRWYRFNGSSWTQIAQSVFGQAAVGLWADPRGGRAYMAFGSRMEGYDAASNQRTTIASIPNIRDFTMSSPTNAVTVGANMFLARWNGARWTADAPPPNTPTIRNLTGAWTDGPSNAWAVGNKSTILHWDGTRWSVFSDTLRQIAGLDDYNAVWGIGSIVLVTGNGILRCTIAPNCVLDAVPGTGALFSVWGTGLNDVFAVGDGGRIVHHDGNVWSQMTSPTTRKLVRVWGSSSSNVWAVGDSVLVHFDGTAWSNVPMTGALTTMQTRIAPTANPFQIGLWGSAANDVYLGGQQGRIARYDGTAWTLMPTPTWPDRVLAISGIAGVGALAMTTFGAVFRGLGPNGGFAATMGAPTIWP